MNKSAMAVWDLEALHDSVMAVRYGPGWEQRAAAPDQPALVDISAVCQQIAELESEVWQEAYADWRHMYNYAHTLEANGVQLLQSFPSGNDRQENFILQLENFLTSSPALPCIQHLIIVGGTGKLRKLLQHQRLVNVNITVIIPPRAPANDLQDLNVHTLNYQPAHEAASPKDATRLVHPSQPPATPIGADQIAEDKRRRNRAAMYQRISAQEGLRLPDPTLMWVGIDIYASFLSAPVGFDSFQTLDEACYEQLHLDFNSATLTDAKKIRQVLFKCYLFTPGIGEKIGFRDDVETLKDLEDLYFELITHRVTLKAPQPVDFAALSLATTGELTSAVRLEAKFTDISNR